MLWEQELSTSFLATSGELCLGWGATAATELLSLNRAKTHDRGFQLAAE